MKIVVNGTPAEAPEKTSLSQFVTSRVTHPEAVIVELNERVVRRDAWESTILTEGDRMELVSLVGGG